MNSSSTNPKIEIVYPEPIKELSESEHHNSQELAKKINEIIRKTNKNG